MRGIVAHERLWNCKACKVWSCGRTTIVRILACVTNCLRFFFFTTFAVIATSKPHGPNALWIGGVTPVAIFETKLRHVLLASATPGMVYNTVDAACGRTFTSCRIANVASTPRTIAAWMRV